MSASQLAITLFGSPHFRLDGKLIESFATRKAQALLTYLVCNPRPLPRDLLAGIFWAEKPESDARNNLRRVLPELRRQFGDYLTVDRQTIFFQRNAACWLDVDEFTAAMRLLRSDVSPSERTVDTLEAALELYTGEFLAGFQLSEAPEFEDWVLMQREYLRELALRGLLFITEHFVKTQQIRRGLAASQRLLSLEPWHETGYQQRMILLAWAGDRPAAIQQYALCTRLLADEFGLPPSPETTDLYARIKAGEFDPVTPPVQVTATAATLPGIEDVPLQPHFVGRDAELAQLHTWGRARACGLIAVMGVGGAGKTALVAHFAHACTAANGAAPFDRVLWASLLNAPPLASLLRIWLRQLAPDSTADLPANVDELMAQLFPHLRAQRCLLVLDNLESIMLEGSERGRFRPGYTEYGRLLERMAEASHASKLILTSRELPSMLVRRIDDQNGAMRVLSLAGLLAAGGAELLAHAGLNEALPEVAELVRRYSGNPLALKLVAGTVRTLYGGDLAAFLAHGAPVFGDIREMLDEQMARLTDLECEIIGWLAVVREPVAVNQVLEMLVGPVERHALLHAMNTLLHTSLVERNQPPHGNGPLRLTLQNVVMEYMTDRLRQAFVDCLAGDDADTFRRYALVTALAPEHVQASQHRLLLQPVAEQAVARWGQAATVERLHNLLARARSGGLAITGYAAANVLHLLLALQADVRGLDLTKAAVWQADLRTADLAGVDFSGADLSGSVFASTLGAIEALAVSSEGLMCAAGGSDGAIYLWRTHDFKLAAVLRRHTIVNGLQFSADGRLLLSIGLDGLICLWDMATMKLAGSIAASERPVLCAALHPDGAHVAIGDIDETIRIWEWRSGNPQMALRVPSVLTNLAYSPDGCTLVSVGDERTICIWDAGSGALRRVLTGHHGKVEAVVFHPAGRRFATGGEDGEIHLWDMESVTPIHTLRGHTDFVLSLAFSSDGALLASCGADQTARLWDVASGALRSILTGHRGWVTTVAFAIDGRALFTGGYDQSVRQWDVHSGQMVRLVRGHLRWVDYVAFSDDGRLLAACSLDGPVRLWDAKNRSLLHTLRGPEAATRSVAFSRANDLLATAGDDHKVRVWDVATGTLLHILSGHQASVRNVCFSPDGSMLITASHDHTLRAWDVASGRALRTIANVSAASRLAIACAPQRQLLAYCTQNDTLVLEEIETGAVVRVFKTSAAQPALAAFDPTGRWLACGTQSGAVLVYDLAAPTEEDAVYYAAPETGAPVWRLIFSPDSTALAWVCTDQEIRLLDLPNQKLRATLPTYFGAFCVAFSRDGCCLVTDGPDHTLLVRDASTGAVLQTLRGHSATVTCIAAAPACNLIASSSVDGSVLLWELAAGICVATLEAERPYVGMKIAGVKGITPAQRAGLLLLGASG